MKAILNTIKANDSIVILTGAGISAESGLETFRASDGLWCNHRIEDVATPEAFDRDPALVHAFYNMRRSNLLDPRVQPNAGHKALAELEEKWMGEVLIVTQNIDNLHEEAGSKNLLHMHGEVLKAFCNQCGHKITCHEDLDTGVACEACGSIGSIRPDIVWFGEMPYHMDKIERAIQDCDLFLSIGTSGNVYPAAGFVQLAKFAGARTAEFNLEPSSNAAMFDDGLYGPASSVLPEFVETLLDNV